MTLTSDLNQGPAQTTISVLPPSSSTLAQPLLEDHSSAASDGSSIDGHDSESKMRRTHSWSMRKRPPSSNLNRPLSLHKHSSQSFAWKFKYEHFWATQPDPEDASLGRGQKEFYRRQRAMLEGFKQVDELSAQGPVGDKRREELVEEAKSAMLAVQLSNAANVVLFVAKLFASITSSSLAVIASTLDSLLDLVAGAILWFTARSLRKPDKYKYPVGNQRMQPVGIIVFAAIMATLGAQVLLEGTRQLFAGDPDTRLNWGELIWVCGVFVFVLVIKFSLFLYCRTFDDDIVQAYAQDHFFDVLTNAVSLASVLLARAAWWVDPGGAIVISIYTIANWSGTVFENAVSLVGMAAPPEFISKVTYMTFNHDPRIRKIDTVRAWTFGTLYMVEVDIELPYEMSLGEAHDIGESLQNKLEALPEVDRAFVHLDYESSHKPEHSGTLASRG